MYLFFERGMRGGSFYISKRYSKVINKYLKSYDPKQGSKHTTYLEADNLYGCAISKFLPTGEIKWINSKEFDLNKYNKNSSKGYVLEVNFKYPWMLNEMYNYYPLAADKIEIKEEMSSTDSWFSQYFCW